MQFANDNKPPALRLVYHDNDMDLGQPELNAILPQESGGVDRENDGSPTAKLR